LLAVPAASLALCGEWRFAIDPHGIGKNEGWTDLEFDDAKWAIVEVPHTWNAMQEHADYQGLAWYRRTFPSPASARDALVCLRFDAVYYQARVWLNGTYFGDHEGGYAPFEFEVSEHLAHDGENVLVVQVDNAARTDRIPCSPMGWYPWGGITRDVSLQVTSRAYVRRQRIVAVPHLVGEDEADEATITVTTWVRNTSVDELDGTLVADVLDETTEETVLAESPRSALRLMPGQEVEVRWEITLSWPRLWHFDHPHLYQWVTSLIDSDGELLHVDQVTFGIRKVALEAERFYLNGEPMRLVGFTRHQDSPKHGSAEPVEVMKADYDDMKRLNVVFTRPVHYPQHEFILDYCDRYGILAIPELPAWQLKPGQMADSDMHALVRQQLREMIDAECNHPSVWAWSVANEIASNTPEGRAFIRDMTAYVKKLDPTRPVTFASDKLGLGAWRDACADFLLMNQYYGAWHGPKNALEPVLDVVHASWPERALFISEWGFPAAWREIVTPQPPRDPSQYYDIAEGLPPDAAEADVMRCQVIAEQMPIIRKKPFVSGAIFWTYQDYRVPDGMYIMGVVDASRSHRPSWQAIREEYAPVLIESVTFLPIVGRGRSAVVTLRARGPLEEDMPVYTLRGYSLRWAVTSAESRDAWSEGDLPVPTLKPGNKWAGELMWAAPKGEYVLTVRVVRPTGFTVIERAYDSAGAMVVH
jgi:hypothetical protein